MKGKHLKAFTISETLVSLIISGFVVGFTYLFISSIYEQFNNYRSTNANSLMFAEQSYQLNRNVFNSTQVCLDADQINLVTDEGEISYPFVKENTFNVIQFSNLDTIKTSRKDFLRLEFIIRHKYGDTRYNVIKELYSFDPCP